MPSKLKTTMQHIDAETTDLTDIVQFFGQAPPGRYTVTIEKLYRPKTRKQLGAIFGLAFRQAEEQAADMGIDLSYVIKYLLNDDIPKGVPLDKDNLKSLAYMLDPLYDEEGKMLTLKRRNTVQANRLFETFCNCMASIGIVISEPDELWRYKDAEENRNG